MTRLPVYVYDANGDGDLPRVVLMCRPNVMDPDTPDLSTAVSYEPAVPRCKTCKHRRYETRDDDAQIDGYWYCEKRVDVEDESHPQDGSGYCHEHSEAMR